MSTTATTPVITLPETRQRLSATPRAIHVAILATTLTVLGSLALLPLWQDALRLWSTDPLRSIGIAFPPIALLGVLAAWRRLHWLQQGTAWALIPIALSIPLARLTSDSQLFLFLHGHRFGLMHPGPVLFLYGLGATLLCGGPKLLRAALPPLCLLLFIDPVPRLFNSLIDLPLQHLSADSARAFAHLIGLQPTGERLRMMFSPGFGMLIVPGCNGLRGALTFAFLTLIFGYTQRLRPRTLTLVTLAALLAGYAVNLLRLCILVLYYRLGIAFPSIQPYGQGTDYTIGITLILLATAAFGLLIRSLNPVSPRAANPTAAPRIAPASPRPQLLRLAAFTALILTLTLPQLHSLTPHLTRLNTQNIQAALPLTVGPYTRLRTYTELDSNHNPAMAFADYTAPPLSSSQPIRRITFGLWLGDPTHLVASSRIVQGLVPTTTGTLNPSNSIHLSTSFYDDSITRTADAEASCTPTGCSSQLIANPIHGRLIFLSPRTSSPDTQRIPILMERIWPSTDPAPPATLRTRFETDASLFASQLDLPSILHQLGPRP